MSQSSQPTFAPAHDQNAPVYSYAIGADKQNRANRDAASGRSARSTVLQGANLRKLFIMREMFEKPVSMRDQEL
jgi:hypothetical protein